MNQSILIGRLTKEPELRYIPGSGTPVATFTLAVDRDYIKQDGSKDTDFIPVEVIGKGAEFVANYIGKGRLVALHGSIRVENYQTQSGEKRTFTKINTRAVQVLDYKKKDDKKDNGFDPNESFDPSFEPIDDDDIPF
ncbi:single-stranded DNA-binding protein [Paeniclostridium hominis]|uniref:single-stranded DNA-binding protein n=1 Tax=Paeniclostridium hominis TaxID=2764329 RepID=UPI0022E3A1FD|nr:single-stranded DNA-binding protein [Paeniclostridium hominis]